MTATAIHRTDLLRHPTHPTIERLDFQMSGLSKRMKINRPLTNCGRADFRAKLQDLEVRSGVTHTEVNAAYSSQTWPSAQPQDLVDRGATQ